MQRFIGHFYMYGNKYKELKHKIKMSESILISYCVMRQSTNYTKYKPFLWGNSCFCFQQCVPLAFQALDLLGLERQNIIRFQKSQTKMHIIRTNIRYFIVAYFTIQDNFSIGFKNKFTTFLYQLGNKCSKVQLIVDKCLEIL